MEHSKKPSSTDLWVNKYAPLSLEGLVGNGKKISDLRRWLYDWKHAKHCGISSRNSARKAALISGPPGIGKTTCVKIICKDLEYTVTEVNASDERSKAASNILDGVKGSTSNTLIELVTNQTFCGTQSRIKRHILVMDEVDGMSGGDRGGISGLIEMIKRSRIPIICICNDRFSQKLKSLQSYCEEFAFQRPSKVQICKRIIYIASKENIDVEESEVSSMIEVYDADMRLIINQLQLSKLSAFSKRAPEFHHKLNDSGSFAIIDKLFSTRSCTLSLDEKFKLAYDDPDITSLFVQENYVQMRPSGSRDDVQRLQILARVSTDISSGDAFGTFIRLRQNWEILPHSVLFGCIIPTAATCGQRETFNMYPGERNFHRFPVWLGKNSTSTKTRRMLGNLHAHIVNSGKCKANFGTMRPCYISMIRTQLTLPLRSIPGTNNNRVMDVLEFMSNYGITKIDWDNIIEQLPMFQGKGVAFAPLTRDITPATKSKLTRACKNVGHIGVTSLQSMKEEKNKEEISENED